MIIKVPILCKVHSTITAVNSYYSCFRDEETEAQRCSMPCPEPQILHVTNWGARLGDLIPKSILFLQLHIAFRLAFLYPQSGFP